MLFALTHLTVSFVAAVSLRPALNFSNFAFFDSVAIRTQHVALCNFRLNQFLTDTARKHVADCLLFRRAVSMVKVQRSRIVEPAPFAFAVMPKASAVNLFGGNDFLGVAFFAIPTQVAFAVAFVVVGFG
jgi:hypothetical protein